VALTWTPQRSVSEPKELVLELTASLWWLYSHKHLGGRLRGRGEGLRGQNQLQEVLRFMRHQEYRLKAAIDAVSTHYRVSHESKSFSFSKNPIYGGSFQKIPFMWNENRPYSLMSFSLYICYMKFP
jgi:hypothetical protein